MFASLRPLAAAIGMSIACVSFAAEPAKPAPKQAAKPAAKPAKPLPSQALAPSGDFELAHNLGPLGAERLQLAVDQFNKEFGGNLKLTRLERGERPAGLNLISRYDLGDVLIRSKEFIPLHQMMAKAGQPLKVGDLSADLKAGAIDAKGQLVALPILYSTPVLFYNKEAFRKAKLDPAKPPATWFEMQGMLDKIQEAGYACPYTTSWPVWVHIDNVSALSGLPSMTEKGELAFNGLPQVKHVAMMMTWTKANYFKHFGRTDEATKHFLSGECAILTSDSRDVAFLHDAKGIDLGVAPLPHHDDVYGGRQHTLADGYTLWVGAGRSDAEYKQAAKFVSFVLNPENQVKAVRAHGALPLTPAARAAARSKIIKDEIDRAIEVAEGSMKGRGAQPAKHVSDIDQVRIIVDEELEQLWADKKPAKAGLDSAVRRGTAVLSARPELRKAQPF